MNVREQFLSRRNEFQSKLRDEMLSQLNESCSEIPTWDATWIYDDGCFFADSKEHQKCFLLLRDNENYIFDTLVILPSDGYPVEQAVYGQKDIAEVITDELFADGGFNELT